MQEIMKVSHLTKQFKEITAVNDISFSVERGELFGFLGENGAGKTTTINMLCTLLTPTAGEARISGYKLGKDDVQIKQRIGVVYQDNCLDEILTVKQNLETRGALYESNWRKQKENLERVCEILELKELWNRRYGKLSGGQKRRCEIARALLHTPEILFLDEPTTGLDPASRQSVWETVSRLQKELGMTVFLTTHYMEEAAKANHIGIMQNGNLIQYGTPFGLKERFAKDKLFLVPEIGKEEQVQMILAMRGYVFRRKEGRLQLMLNSTMEALNVLEEVRQYLTGFEVIQGTMDDVFLNAIKEENHE
ncbi:MAG: ABC transporter ATP-binding protein [Lachnospiraceae bacterium]|nr:ABC transporter ATP-binding protein [Lachnospiraceae bacterium]